MMKALQMMLLEKAVTIVLSQVPDPGKAHADFVRWVDEKTSQTSNEFDDLLVPIVKLANHKEMREVFDEAIDWLQAYIAGTETKLDDLALPFLEALEETFGDPAD